MSPPSRQDVLAEIARRFPSELRTAVLKALNFYGARPSEPERERVQLAILERSQGDADKLRLLVEQAKKDYRSVLGGEAAASPPDPLSAVGTSPPGPLSAKRRGGTGVRAGEDEPRWVQVFIGICLCIPVFSWGMIPLAIALVGAAWCRRIAWDLDRPERARVVACAGVTLLCYTVIALGLSGLALV